MGQKKCSGEKKIWLSFQMNKYACGMVFRGSGIPMKAQEFPLPDLNESELLVKIKYANIINIINNKEIIPELIQNECNSKEIFKSVVYFLKNPNLMTKQIDDFSNTLDEIRSKSSSADEASSIILKYLA